MTLLLAPIRPVRNTGQAPTVVPFLYHYALVADAMNIQAIPEPRIEFAFEARVSIDRMLIVGPSSHGLRRIVPTLGGSVEGPKFQRRVVPGGADWQFVRPDGVLELEARYTLESHDGELIMV